MNHQVIASLNGFVLLPIECKEDILNFSIHTPFLPTMQDFATIMDEQKKERTEIVNKLKQIGVTQ